jgi:hypothetical protein
MAIQLNNSKIDKKRDALLDPAYTGVLERGMVMVYSGNASAEGEQMVKPCTGAASEKVAGILWLSETAQEDIPTFEDAAVPAASPFTVTVRDTPLAGTYRVLDVAGNADLVETTDYTVAGKVFTFDAAQAEKAVRIFYRYAITAAVLARRGGRRSVNQGAERLFNQVTLCYGFMRVMLSNYDTSKSFDPITNKTVKCAAGGKLTIGGAGTTVGQVVQGPVLHLTPGIEQSFITIETTEPIL